MLPSALVSLLDPTMVQLTGATERISRVEFFEVDDLDAALTRFDELTVEADN